MGNIESTREAEAAAAAGARESERTLFADAPAKPTPEATGVKTKRQASARRAGPA